MQFCMFSSGHPDLFLGKGGKFFREKKTLEGAFSLFLRKTAHFFVTSALTRPEKNADVPDFG